MQLEVESVEGDPLLNRPHKKSLDHTLETHLSPSAVRGVLARDLALTTGESIKKYDSESEEDADDAAMRL